MSLKCYLYPTAPTPDTDIPLAKVLCQLVRDIFSAIAELLQSATTILAAVIPADLQAIFTVVSDKVAKGNPINLPLFNIGQNPIIAGTAIPEPQQAFGTAMLQSSKALLRKSGTAG